MRCEQCSQQERCRSCSDEAHAGAQQPRCAAGAAHRDGPGDAVGAAARQAARAAAVGRAAWRGRTCRVAHLAHAAQSKNSAAAPRTAAPRSQQPCSGSARQPARLLSGWPGQQPTCIVHHSRDGPVLGRLCKATAAILQDTDQQLAVGPAAGVAPLCASLPCDGESGAPPQGGRGVSCGLQPTRQDLHLPC